MAWAASCYDSHVNECQTDRRHTTLPSWEDFFQLPRLFNLCFTSSSDPECVSGRYISKAN